MSNHIQVRNYLGCPTALHAQGCKEYENMMISVHLESPAKSSLFILLATIGDMIVRHFNGEMSKFILPRTKVMPQGKKDGGNKRQ